MTAPLNSGESRGGAILTAELNPFVGPFEWRRLAKSVAGDFGITAQDLLSPKRERRCAHARAVFISLLLDRGWSFAKIGRLLGRDHSTIIHAEQMLPVYIGHFNTPRLSLQRHHALRAMAAERMAA